MTSVRPVPCSLSAKLLSEAVRLLAMAHGKAALLFSLEIFCLSVTIHKTHEPKAANYSAVDDRLELGSV